MRQSPPLTADAEHARYQLARLPLKLQHWHMVYTLDWMLSLQVLNQELVTKERETSWTTFRQESEQSRKLRPFSGSVAILVAPSSGRMGVVVVGELWCPHLSPEMSVPSWNTSVVRCRTWYLAL